LWSKNVSVSLEKGQTYANMWIFFFCPYPTQTDINYIQLDEISSSLSPWHRVLCVRVHEYFCMACSISLTPRIHQSVAVYRRRRLQRSTSTDAGHLIQVKPQIKFSCGGSQLKSRPRPGQAPDFLSLSCPRSCDHELHMHDFSFFSET
jgi:hypothetical protein